MQLIVTGREERSPEVAYFRNRTWSVHIVPVEKLPNEFRQGDVLVADAIVCYIDFDDEQVTSPPTYPVQIRNVHVLLQEIRRLPEDCAMLDGRKWKALPIILVASSTAAAFFRDELNRVAVEHEATLIEAVPEFYPTADAIERLVRDYRQRLLAEFSNLGFVVTLQRGRYRVGPALQSKEHLEGFFYYGRADRRVLSGGYFTVDRDLCGIQHEVEVFERLINDPETAEAELQKFFEQHPHFLGDLQQSIPMPHVRLEHPSGTLYIPDFILKPIVAYQRDANWRVLDLKKPNARLLAGPANHVRLSHDVTQAIAQLRDYRDYFRDQENSERIRMTLGHRLRYPELAVLIGRLGDSDQELLDKAQAREPDVRIVTYDEVLQHQQHLLT